MGHGALYHSQVPCFGLFVQCSLGEVLVKLLTLYLIESWVVLCTHTGSQDCHSTESFKGQGLASFLYQVYTVCIMMQCLLHLMMTSYLKRVQYLLSPPGTRTPVFSLSPRSCTGPTINILLFLILLRIFHSKQLRIIFCFIDRSAVEQVPTKDYECPLGKVGKFWWLS